MMEVNDVESPTSLSGPPTVSPSDVNIMAVERISSISSSNIKTSPTDTYFETNHPKSPKKNDDMEEEDGKCSLLMRLLIIHTPLELLFAIGSRFVPFISLLIQICFPSISRKRAFGTIIPKRKADYMEEQSELNDVAEMIDQFNRETNTLLVDEPSTAPDSNFKTAAFSFDNTTGKQMDLLQNLHVQEPNAHPTTKSGKSVKRNPFERLIHGLGKKLSSVAKKLKLKKASKRSLDASASSPLSIAAIEQHKAANFSTMNRNINIDGGGDNGDDGAAHDRDSVKSGASSEVSATSILDATKPSNFYDKWIPDHWRTKPPLLTAKKPRSSSSGRPHPRRSAADANASATTSDRPRSRSRSNSMIDSALDSAKQMLVGMGVSKEGAKRKSDRMKKRRGTDHDLKYKLMLDPRVNPDVRRSRRQEDFNLFLTIFVFIYCSVCGYDFSSRYLYWKYRSLARYFHVGSSINNTDSPLGYIYFRISEIDQKFIVDRLDSITQSLNTTLTSIRMQNVTLKDVKYLIPARIKTVVTPYANVSFYYINECLAAVRNIWSAIEYQFFSMQEFVQGSYKCAVILVGEWKSNKIKIDDLLRRFVSRSQINLSIMQAYVYGQVVIPVYEIITDRVLVSSVVHRLDQLMRMKPKSAVTFYKPVLPTFIFPNRSNVLINVTDMAEHEIEDFLLSPYNLQTILELLTSLLLVGLTYHRLCAYVILFCFRLFLSGSLIYTGKFDAHCEWIAVRGTFPYIEVVIRNFLWRNPPQFKKTPYLIYCHHFRIHFNVLDWYKTIMYGRTCKYGSVEINSLEIFHEKVDRGTEEESLNLWVALGAEDSDSESAWLRLLFKSVWESIRRKVMGVLLRNAMRGGRASSDEDEDGLVDDDMAELRRLYNAHFENDSESDVGSDIAAVSDTSSVLGDGTENKTRETTTRGKRRHSITKLFGKSKYSKPESGPATNINTSDSVNTTPKFDWNDPFWSLVKILETKPMELESFTLQNFVMHPLSLIARFSTFSAQLATSTSTSFRIKLLHLNRRQMTGTNPKDKRGKRIPLKPAFFIDKLGEHLVKTVIMSNSIRLFTILGALGLQQALRSMGYLKRSLAGDSDFVKDALSDGQSDAGDFNSPVDGENVPADGRYNTVSTHTVKSVLSSSSSRGHVDAISTRVGEAANDDGRNRALHSQKNKALGDVDQISQTNANFISPPPISDLQRINIT